MLLQLPRLSLAQRRELLGIGRPRLVEAGSMLYLEGDAGTSLLLVRRGRLRAFKSFFGKTSTMATLGPGDLFGEVSVFDTGERSTTVEAVSDCRLLEFGRDELLPILRRSPELSIYCLAQMAARVRQVQQDLVEELVQRNLELELSNARLEARIRERTELQRSNQQLSHLADRDHLTGCLNRRALQDRLTLWTAEPDIPFTLLLFDIDHFKHYNDSQGHLQGDQLLKTLVNVVGSHLRSQDLLARFGGEEFAVLLHGLLPPSAPEVAQRISAAVAEHAFPERESQPLGLVSISAGLAYFPQESTTPEGLLQLADERLYEAKAGGRNQVVAGTLQLKN